MFCFFFFFTDTATTEIYTLSLHDALPIYIIGVLPIAHRGPFFYSIGIRDALQQAAIFQENLKVRSEEHTSELQSRQYLVCRLLLEKKKKEIKHMKIYQYITNLNYRDNTCT